MIYFISSRMSYRTKYTKHGFKCHNITIWNTVDSSEYMRSTICHLPLSLPCFMKYCITLDPDYIMTGACINCSFRADINIVDITLSRYIIAMTNGWLAQCQWNNITLNATSKFVLYYKIKHQNIGMDEICTCSKMTPFHPWLHICHRSTCSKDCL